MKVIKPITFTESFLVSSDATEAIGAWSSATTYAKDAEVNYLNSIWVSLISSNTNKTPGGTYEPIAWLKKSSNNKFSMFDDFVNTQTSKNLSLTVVLKPNEMVGSTAVLNINGASQASVTVQNGTGGEVVFYEIIELEDTLVTDWFQYFFEETRYKDEIIIQNLPPYLDPVITYNFTGVGDIKVGNLVLGTTYNLGHTQEGASGGIRDYSTKTVNEFGIPKFTKRAFSKRMDCTLFVNNGDLNQVYQVLSDLRATPSVWIGTDYKGYSVLNMYGYYKDFNIEIAYPSVSMCRLEIEGLI